MRFRLMLMCIQKSAALACLAVLASLCIALSGGCDGNDPPAAVIGPSKRVVSLAPSLTQMIQDLGAGDLIVAVAENDDVAPNLPTVGNYLNVNREALIAARATHVVMLYGKEGVPDVLRDLEASAGFRLLAYPYPDSIEQMMQILDRVEKDDSATADAPASLGEALDRKTEGFLLSNQFYFAFARIAEAVSDRPRSRVLMLINAEQLIASGRDTVHDDVLVFLNASNAVRGFRSSAPKLDREMLIAAKPQVILLLQPNAPPLKSLDEDPRLAVLRDLDIPAVTDNRIVLINDPQVLLPSTSLVRIGVSMAKAIYPDLSDKFDKVLAPDNIDVQASETTEPSPSE